jgi:hypothetical protein
MEFFLKKKVLKSLSENFSLHSRSCCRISNENDTMSYNNRNFVARSTRRQSFSHLFSHNHSRVLLLNNDRLHGSLMTFQSQNSINIPLEEIERAICNVSEHNNTKRSIMSLQSSDLIAKRMDAITTCPSSIDQLCLNMRDNNDDDG